MGTSDSPFHPDFVAQMQKLYPLHAEAYFDALSKPPPVSIRVNSRKGSQKPAFDCELQSVPWEKQGFYLSDRPIFTLDPLFHAGQYYVQEASSMMIGSVAEQIIQKIDPARVDSTSKNSLRVLDLCGAPGGKSTHLVDKLQGHDILLTNEVIRSRSAILTENIIKWGAANTAVSCNDPDHFRSLGPWFDIIVVDAPCSGEGLFRKDPDAIAEWSLDAVNHCALRQNRILDAIWPALKPGGYLIYSTCTYNDAENDEQIVRVMKSGEAESTTIDTSTMPGILVDILPESDINMYRCLPGLVHGEGLTFSILKKKSQASAYYPDDAYSSKNLFARVKSPANAKALTNHESFEYLQNKNAVFAVPKALVKDVLELDKTLNLVHVGVELGDEKRPAHSLAMSQHLQRGFFPEVEVDLDLALEYLRRETIRIDTHQNGTHLVAINGTPLGFGKVTQGRINNHYPMEWRIRMRK
jgi:16S rRNA C967 or C1407 C5-methylase (RsmB/RsmF family)/NOL1/NOP2/fmu family ribosome biogenesis protein